MSDKGRVWTLPNIITLARIGVFPFLIVFAYIERSLDSENAQRTVSLISTILFVIAFLSDSLDGYLARKRNEVTTLGKFLDPLSDKVVVTTALIMLVMLDRTPAWLATVIILREIAVTGLRTLAADDGVIIAASIWGKSKTVMQVIAITLLLLHYDREIFGLAINFHFLGEIAMYLALGITIYSGWEYFWAYFTVQKKTGMS